jgi:hypothetical protein
MRAGASLLNHFLPGCGGREREVDVLHLDLHMQEAIPSRTLFPQTKALDFPEQDQGFPCLLELNLMAPQPELALLSQGIEIGQRDLLGGQAVL